MENKESCDLGIITMAYGAERYYEQARNLAISLHINMPDLPVALVTDREKIDSNLFDYCIPLDSRKGKGVSQKVFLDQYSPFKETLFLDSDCIVTKSFDEQLENIRKYDFSPVCSIYLSSDDSDDFLEDLPNVLNMLGVEKIPKFNGGLYFFRQGKQASLIFDTARYILENYKKFGAKDFDAYGPNEETIFSLSCAKLKTGNLYDDDGYFMRPTINVDGEFSINPLGGGCEFRPWGVLSCPAICHFVRSNVFNHHYLRCEILLRNKYGDFSTLLLYFKAFNKYIFSLLLYHLKMFSYHLRKIVRKNILNSLNKSLKLKKIG